MPALNFPFRGLLEVAEDFEAAEGAVRTACGLELGETAGRGAVRGRAGSLGSEFQPKLVVSFELKGFSKSLEHCLGTPGSFGFLSTIFLLPCVAATLSKGSWEGRVAAGLPPIEQEFCRWEKQPSRAVAANVCHLLVQ